jgi:uncharacterized circularly permuted ATP-grasp superfamily protein
MQSLDEIVRDLDRRILADPAVSPRLFATMIEAEREGGLLHGDRPICPFLRPYMLPRSRYDEIASVARTLAGAFERVVESALGDDRLVDLLGATEREASLARVEPGYGSLCVSSRLDAFLTEDGFQFLEYNAESPAGLGDQRILERVLDRVPSVREFLDEQEIWRPRPHHRVLGALLDAHAEWGGGDRERPRIAIVDWAGVPTESEFHILADYFNAEGYPTVIADPGDLRYDGRSLEVGGEPVDILYKRVIIHELLGSADDSHPIVRAYMDGRICMANSFRAKLAHKKASFAVLSDPQYAHLFTDEQREAIRRHIPWTRVVREGVVEHEGREWTMRELLDASRERLVLKPNDDYGGHDVVVGHATSPEEWSAAIERAFAGTYVVQECIPMHREPIPVFEGDRVEMREMTVDFDPFLFHNEVEGGLVRMSSTALSNVSSGGGETALIVVEGY